MANLLFIIVWLAVALAINASLARYIKAKLAPVAMSLLVVSNPTSSLRSSQSTSASDYNTYSSNYDTVNSGKIADTLGITDLRRSAADFIKGDVLEVAAGTGLQLEYNNWEKIRSYLAVDNSEGMLQQLQQRISSKAPDIQKKFSQKVQDAENLESLDKFDTVVDTFSMCVFEDPLKVVKAMASAIKPNGRIVLLENTRSAVAILGTLQDVTEPLITPTSKGCKWNTDVPRIAANAGLIKEYSQSIQLGTMELGVYKKK